MKLTPTQQRIITTAQAHPIIREGGGLPFFQRRIRARSIRRNPNQKRIAGGGARRTIGGLHPNLSRGVAMSQMPKALVIVYKSGRKETLKFDTHTETRNLKEKLEKSDAVVSVGWA